MLISFTRYANVMNEMFIIENKHLLQGQYASQRSKQTPTTIWFSENS